MADYGIDQRIDITAHNLIELMERHSDAVIGDAILFEIVGANLLGAIAGADLRAALGRNRILLLLRLHLEKSRSQHAHRLLAVLDLRLLVLHRYDQTGRQDASMRTAE